MEQTESSGSIFSNVCEKKGPSHSSWGLLRPSLLTSSLLMLVSDLSVWLSSSSERATLSWSRRPCSPNSRPFCSAGFLPLTIPEKRTCFLSSQPPEPDPELCEYGWSRGLRGSALWGDWGGKESLELLLLLLMELCFRIPRGTGVTPCLQESPFLSTDESREMRKILFLDTGLLVFGVV